MRRAVLLGAAETNDPQIPVLHVEDQLNRLGSLLADPELCGFAVSLLLGPTTSEAMRTLEQIFGELRDDDLLLFYFSGHGLKDHEGQLYFAMRDTELSLLQSTSLSAAFVRTQMNRTRAGQVVVLLDCSYGGEFVRQAR